MNTIVPIRIAAMSGLLVLAASSAHSASVLVSQPFDQDGFLTSITNQPYQVFDDFTVVGGGTVTEVDRSGINRSGEANNIIEFSLQFWSYSFGTPGTMLASQYVSDSADETYSGANQDGVGPINNYAATLSTPFTATNGTKYFLTIQAYLPSFQDWVWETSGVGNNGVYLQYGFEPVERNVAFTLLGTEGLNNPSAPDGGSTGLLLGMVLGGLCFVRRKLS